MPGLLSHLQGYPSWLRPQFPFLVDSKSLSISAFLELGVCEFKSSVPPLL